MNISALQVDQVDQKLVLFSLEASAMERLVDISERDSDKDEGYQRVLSKSRVRAVAKYIDDNNIIPTAIVIAFNDHVKYVTKSASLEFDDSHNGSYGWVVDGQHRLAGAVQADNPLNLIAVGILNASLDTQIQQFVTINKEAKGVPTSLYYDLRNHLPPKKSSREQAKDRAADIADALKKDERSIWYNRITISSPQSGQISLNNFVRKVNVHVFDPTGIVSNYSYAKQVGIFHNYFQAWAVKYKTFFRLSNSVFYKTVGFGAMLDVFPDIFNVTRTNSNGAFRITDIQDILDKVEFDPSQWSKLGTGTKAEKQAADDFRAELKEVIEDNEEISEIRLD